MENGPLLGLEPLLGPVCRSGHRPCEPGLRRRHRPEGHAFELLPKPPHRLSEPGPGGAPLLPALLYPGSGRSGLRPHRRHYPGLHHGQLVQAPVPQRPPHVRGPAPSEGGRQHGGEVPALPHQDHDFGPGGPHPGLALPPLLRPGPPPAPGCGCWALPWPSSAPSPCGT